MKTMTTHLSRLACVGLLLATAQAAHAWTAADCNQQPFAVNDYSVKGCERSSRIQEQQNQPDGSPPTEAQRLERVREILRNQKLIELSEVRDRSTPDKKRREAIARCEPRLKDLLEGKGFEPIEPVFILDDVWNGDTEVRVPAIWNSCANAEDRTNTSVNNNYTREERISRARNPIRTIASVTGNRLNRALPPHRLYELNERQRPDPKWRYMIDRSLADVMGEGQNFEAISFDKCEIVGAISSNPYGFDKRQQSWALTHYGNEVVVARIVDGFGLQLNSHNLKQSCTWYLFPAEPSPKR